MDDGITELVDLDAQKVSGVEKPANGTPFLVIKAAACSTCGGTGKINDGNRDCPDCDGAAKSSSAEADAFEAEATGDGDGAAEKAAVEVEVPDVETAAAPAKKASAADELAGAIEKAHGLLLDKLSELPGVVMRGEFASPSALAAARVVIGVDGSVVKSPGVPMFALNTPGYTGVNSAMAQSGLRGPMTGTPTDPNDGDGEAKSEFEGATSTYPIPAEMGMARKAASLFEAIALIAAMRENELVTKDMASMLPSGTDMPSLSDIATALAHASAALDKLAAVANIESMAGEPDAWEDAWDLSDAVDATEFALGVAARMAFQELAEAGAEKASAGGTTNQTGDGQEDVIDMQMTKEELGTTVADAVGAALAAAGVSKDSPGIEHGNLSEGEISDNGTIGAGLEGVGGSVDSDYVNKGELADVIAKAVADATAGLAETVAKLAAQPMPGGPILDGISRGSFPAEGRSVEAVIKQADEAEAALVEKVAKAEAGGTAEQLSRAQQELSQMRLYKQHLGEYGEQNPLTAMQQSRADRA